MPMLVGICHAQVVSCHRLNGTRWKLVSPQIDYCDRTMSFSTTVRTTKTKFKTSGKEYKCPKSYYITTSIPTKFDKAQVGKNQSGRYIIQFVDDKVFWFKIISYDGKSITLLSKLGDTTTYKKL